MEFALEMIIKSAQIVARIAEIPIILWPGKRGRAPHLRSFRDGWRSLRFMLPLRAELAFPAAGCRTGFWPDFPRVLAVAGTAANRSAMWGSTFTR